MGLLLCPPVKYPARGTTACPLRALILTVSAHSRHLWNVIGGWVDSSATESARGCLPHPAHLCSALQAGGNPCWSDCRGDADGGGGGACGPRQPGFRGQGDGARGLRLLFRPAQRRQWVLGSLKSGESWPWGTRCLFLRHSLQDAVFHTIFFLPQRMTQGP